MAVELVKVVALACLITTCCVSTPTPGIVPTTETEQGSPKYEYSYVVKDDYGGTQGHVETRKGEYATGKYYVHVPGGIDQKVDYFADDWGYHPLVEYKSLSRSGSSSTQFALGEKAVAALTKSQARVQPDKAIRVRASSPRPRASVLIHSSSGIISNPRANEQQAESTAELPTPTPLLSFKSTSGVVNNPNELYEDSENNIRTSTVESVKIIGSARHVNRHSPRTQIHSATEAVRQATDPEINSAHSEDISIVNFESKKNVPDEQVTKSSREHEDYFGNSASPSTTDSADSYSPNDFAADESHWRNETSSPSDSSARNEESVEITSYLADSNSAIDVTTKNITDAPEKPEVGSSNAHTISAVFFAESEQKHDDNEIQSESSHVSSTEGPETDLSKFSFGPIIVPDYPRNKELSDFFLNSSKSEEKEELGNYNIEDEETSLNNELKTTARPFRTTVPDSDKIGDTSLGSSTDELLAPIQAGVSLSAEKAESVSEPSHSKTTTGNEYSVDVDDVPEIEKQVIQKEAVYKTTVDIQKSIPLEISGQNVKNDQQIASRGAQNVYTDLEQQQRPAVIKFNELPPSESPHLAINNDVLTSQQRVSNYNDLQPNVNDAHINRLQNIPPTTYLPSNLYYIYLQRYNPYTNRYSIVPQPVVLQPYHFAVNPINNINNQLYQSIPQLQSEAYSLIADGSKLNTLDTDIQHAVLPTVEQNVDSPYDFDKNTETVPSGEFQQSLANSQTLFSQTDDNEDSNLGTKPAESSESSRNNNHQHLADSDGESRPRSAQTLASTYAAQLNALTAARYNEIHSSDSQVSEVKVDTTQEAKQSIQNENANNYSGKEVEYFKDPSGSEPNQNSNNVFKGDEFNGDDQVTGSNKIASGENIVPAEKLASEGTKVTTNNPFKDPIFVGVEPSVRQEQLFLPGIPGSVFNKPVAFRQPYPPLPPHIMKHPKQLLMPPHHTRIATITVKQHQPVSAKSRRGHQIQIEKSHQPPFIPSQKVFSSVYPPETYYVTQYMTRQDRSGGKSSRQLIIEYGGFKPPMVPSVQIDVEPTTSTNDQTIESKPR